MQEYLLHLADNVLILGHRLSEWCGHGPALEIDMAMTNISLDLIGEARNLYQYAAELQSPNVTEDDLAYLRDVGDFRNVLLVEQPNGDFAHTIARHFLFDAYHFFLMEQLQNSSDERLAAIAAKSLKEVAYHLRWTSEWVIRLGDGTEESHRRMQTAIDELWPYRGELFVAAPYEQAAATAGYGIDPATLREKIDGKVAEILTMAKLQRPQDGWSHSGGKTGRHSEYLGFILAEMQFVPRAYPNSTW